MGDEASLQEAESTASLPDGTEVTVRVRTPHPKAEEMARFATAAAADRLQKDVPSLAEREALSETGIVGASDPMRALFKMLGRIRNSNATVLITGENGTGKELVAHSIHEQSNRNTKRFVATNCSAFNDNLLESELFGHRRGAFTGAVSDKPGLFSVADSGTFFLDEVGDMSPALQVKLLRVLQEGVFLPVGATEPKRVDVRIIAATNRDLQAMVKAGTFREDLYYRLHVVALTVPPLRDRPSDIPLLAEHFLSRLAKRDGRSKSLTSSVMVQLMGHRWPGNVRELENEIERLWVLSGDDPMIGPEHLTPVILKAKPSAAPPAMTSTDDSTLPAAVEALERRMIEEGLQRAKGNKTRAAEALGISRRNLIRKVQNYGLEGAGKS